MQVVLLFPRQFWPTDADMFGRMAETTAERGDFNLFYPQADLAGEPAALADPSCIHLLAIHWCMIMQDPQTAGCVQSITNWASATLQNLTSGTATAGCAVSPWRLGGPGCSSIPYSQQTRVSPPAVLRVVRARRDDSFIAVHIECVVCFLLKWQIASPTRLLRLLLFICRVNRGQTASHVHVVALRDVMSAPPMHDLHR